MEAKETLSQAHAALIQCDYKRAIGYYEQLLRARRREQIMRPKCHRRRRRRKLVEKREQVEAEEMKRNLYLGYANALACCESPTEDVPLASALHVYRELMGANLAECNDENRDSLVDSRILERLLRNVITSLVERLRSTPLNTHLDRCHNGESSARPVGNIDLEIGAVAHSMKLRKELPPVDPLLCGICDGILNVPVTGPCGHTFCRQCVVLLRKCSRCPEEDLSPLTTITTCAPPLAAADNGENGCYLEKDVLICRLVEKWWGAELKAEPRVEDARHYLEAAELDQALRSANESLEQAPNGFSGLLIRSEVLYRLGQFQSALADAESALRSRPASAKAHYRRADALTGLGEYEAALMAFCIGCAWERSNNVPVAVRHDMTRLLHQVIVPSVCSRPRATTLTLPGRHWRRQWQSMAEENGGNRQLLGHWPPPTTPREPSLGGLKRSRRNMCHSMQELVVSLSDCEEQAGLMAEQYERQRKRRRKCERTKVRNVFKRIRQYSYSSSEPADEDVFAIDEKAMATIVGLPEMNLYEQDHEQVGEEDEEELEQVATEYVDEEWIAVDVNDLLDRIFTAVDESKGVSVHVNRNLIESSDFDCVLCYRPLWRPVVTPCGHTYCSICLDRCMDYRQQCPLCMSQISDALSLTKRNATLFIVAAMERFIPELCGRRQSQDAEPSVPIFICTAAFPNVPCPLLVSEPRYRLMVRQAIESGEKQFGMTHLIGVPTASGRQQYSEYGTMLDIRDCVLLENGWSILSTVGCRRFRVVAKGERDGYDTAKVEFICDSPIGKEKVKQMTKLHKDVFDKAIGWFDSLPETYKTEIVKSFGRMPQPEDGWISITDGPAWTWWVIAILPLHQQLKGKIIAEINLEKRLKAIDKTLFTLQDRSGTRNGQRLRHAAAAGSTTDAYAVNEVAVVPQEAIDCCQRGAGGSSTRAQEDLASPNKSTQFLL